MIEGEYDAFDRAMALSIHRIATPVLDQVMIAVTNLDSGPILALVVLATAVWSWRHGHRRTTLILISNAVVSQLVVFVLKVYVQRPRPTLFDVIARPESWSFPSGHSSSATVAAMLLGQRDPRRRPVYGVMAAIVATSRVHVQVHHASDVVAGVAVGAAIGRFVTRRWPVEARR